MKLRIIFHLYRFSSPSTTPVFHQSSIQHYGDYLITNYRRDKILFCFFYSISHLPTNESLSGLVSIMSSGPFAPRNSSSEAPRQNTQGFAHWRRSAPCPKEMKNAVTKNVETCSQMTDERQIRSLILQKCFFEKCSHLMSPNSVCSYSRLNRFVGKWDIE